MNQPSPSAQFDAAQDGPPLFTGIQFVAGELVIGGNMVNAKVRDLQTAIAERHVANTKQAADDIAKIAGQMQTLSAHLATVIARHMARNPRV